MDGYGVDVSVNNVCLPCSMPNCLLCGNDYQKCYKCSLGLGIKSGPYTCMPCSDFNCLDCSYNMDFCQQCSLTYGVQIRNGNLAVCSPCSINHCINCATNYANCISCEDGYIYDGNSTCQPCQSPCLNCNNTITSCLSCITNNYYINTIANLCYSCSNINSKCLNCTSSSFCVLCSIGYYAQNSDGQCYQCATQCL
jgi:hypothetical protein